MVALLRLLLDALDALDENDETTDSAVPDRRSSGDGTATSNSGGTGASAWRDAAYSGDLDNNSDFSVRRKEAYRASEISGGSNDLFTIKGSTSATNQPSPLTYMCVGSRSEAAITSSWR
jgi:hypothetical protein